MIQNRSLIMWMNGVLYWNTILAHSTVGDLEVNTFDILGENHWIWRHCWTLLKRITACCWYKYKKNETQRSLRIFPHCSQVNYCSLKKRHPDSWHFKSEKSEFSQSSIKIKEWRKKQSLTVSCLHLQTDSSHHHKSPAERQTKTQPLVIFMYIHLPYSM